MTLPTSSFSERTAAADFCLNCDGVSQPGKADPGQDGGCFAWIIKEEGAATLILFMGAGTISFSLPVRSKEGKKLKVKQSQILFKMYNFIKSLKQNKTKQKLPQGRRVVRLSSCPEEENGGEKEKSQDI